MSGAAEDRIYLTRDGSNVIPIAGDVIDFTGRAIQYRSQGGGVKSEPTSNVAKVETSYPEAYARGQKQFDAGQYDLALAEWQEALKAESRTWVQREIRASLIRAAWRRSDWTLAGGQFLEIVASDPQTMHWSVAPLVWVPTKLRESDRAAAKNWLSSSDSAARLLGASWLLTDAELGESAFDALKELTRDVSRVVADHARAQLWRRRIGITLSDSELAGWRSHAESLPEKLRGGPTYLIARARQTRSEFDLAAAEYLWVSVVYTQHEPTAARATLDAAENLVKLGRPDQARRLFHETTERFPWSVSAQDASSRLKELDSADANP